VTGLTKLPDRLVRLLSPSRLDPAGLGAVGWNFWRSLLRQPSQVVAGNLQLAADQLQVLSYALRKSGGRDTELVIEPPRGDRRFRHDLWRDQLPFDLLKQSYLVTAEHVMRQVGAADLEPHQQHKLEFWTRQALDALSPSNFAATNPEVLERIVETRGLCLLQGFANLAADLRRGRGRLQISMVDERRFEVGGNLATTPGKVVFENELMQLIQYAPSTDKVYERPLLIVPPWINKFYILDLKPENSFIAWAVAQGYTVFVVSWVNPDERLAHKTFEDYLNEGVFDAVDAVRRATGEETMNAIGYCIGGTLLACALAIMAEHGDDRIRSATFFTTQVDFSEPGDLQVYIDEPQLRSLERRMAKRGYLDAADMATSFNLLRANDLIWSFVVNNYLLGRSPAPFDLLYWNGDSTRMPGAMHRFYLREMYLHNRLAQPGGIVLNDIPVDLRRIEIPVFLQSSREDHIAPYPSVYKAAKIYSGPVTFLLAGSGHIAGVINPPAANKYGYWTRPDTPPTADEWLDGAEAHDGSWWPYWHQWLYRRSGRKVAARQPGDGELPALEDAPGRYVKMR